MAENNEPAEWLVTHVARQQLLLVELLAATERLPVEFVSPTARHEPVLFDFSYLRSAEALDARVEASEALSGAWEEVRRRCSRSLARFYRLLAAVTVAHAALLRFLADLDAGVYTSHTLEEVLREREGRQLLLEALQLATQLPLLLELRVEGKTRERLVVAHLRCVGTSEAEVPHCEQVVRLARSSGYACASAPELRPQGWPEDYLSRFPLPPDCVQLVLGRLRMEDVYGGAAHFPSPGHRAAALAAQAAATYLLLFHSPDTLLEDGACMRELVDRQFAEGWVLAWAPGYIVDLTVAWQPYKAARGALETCLPPAAARRLGERHGATLGRLVRDIQPFLAEGLLDEAFLLTHFQRLFDTLRDGNVALRWLLLHTQPPPPPPPMTSSHPTTTARRRRASARPAPPAPPRAAPQPGRLLSACAAKAPPLPQIVELLLLLSRLEEVLRTAVTSFLDTQGGAWSAALSDSQRRLAELSRFYGAGASPSDGPALSAGHHDPALAAWFERLRAALGELDPAKPVGSGRRLAAMTVALGEVEGFRSVDASLASRAFLGETKESFGRLARLLHVAPSSLATLAALCDAGWAWAPAQPLLPLLRDRLASRPSEVHSFRCLLLKLRTLMELPLLRPGQLAARAGGGAAAAAAAAEGAAAVSQVSAFYSRLLASFAEDVLSVVPTTMFSILATRIAPRVADLRELPTRLEKTALAAEAQLEARFELARATHAVSEFTQGVFAMEKTFVGVLELQPRRLLGRGVRRALGAHIVHILREGLGAPSPQLPASTARNWLGVGVGGGSAPTLPRPQTHAQLSAMLGGVSERLAALRRSFEATQEFVNCVQGSAWGRELGRACERAAAAERRALLGPGCDQDESGEFMGGEEEEEEEESEGLDAEVGQGGGSEGGSDSDREEEEETAGWAAAPPVASGGGLGEALSGGTWLGCVSLDLLRITASPTVYLPSHAAWYAPSLNDGLDAGEEALGMRAAALLRGAVGLPGLAALGTALEALQQRRLTSLLSLLSRKLGDEEDEAAADSGVAQLLRAVEGVLGGGGENMPAAAVAAFLAEASARLGRLLGGWGAVLECVAEIGRAQLLRRWLAGEQARCAASDAHLLFRAVEAVDTSVRSGLRYVARHGPEEGEGGAGGGGEKERKAAARGLLAEVAALRLSTGGGRDVLREGPPVPANQRPAGCGRLGRALPLLALLLTAHALPRFALCPRLRLLRPLKRHVASTPDASALVTGLVQLLRCGEGGEGGGAGEPRGGGQVGLYAALLTQLCRSHAQAQSDALAGGGGGGGSGAGGPQAQELAVAFAWAQSLGRLGGLRQRLLDRFFDPWLAAVCVAAGTAAASRR